MSILVFMITAAFFGKCQVIMGQNKKGVRDGNCITALKAFYNSK